MTTCEQVRPHLSGYVDRHLDAAQAGEVRAHLLSCDACRGIADDLGRLRDAARRLGPIEPPPHVWLEIAGRVRLEAGAPEATPSTRAAQAPRRSRSDTWQWLGLAAALLLMTLGVYSVTRPDQTAPAPTVAAIPGNAPEIPTVETVEETMRRAEAEYEKAIAQLEQVVKS